MSNPWDPLPLPLLGNQDESVLFAALGRALNRWEYIEFGLAYLYCLFVRDDTWDKVQEYGEGRIFRERLDGLKRVADAWFIASPDQTAEGDFQRLTLAASGFADRRNEIAHGLVMDVRKFLFWRTVMKLAFFRLPQFIVMPPWHLRRKHDPVTKMPIFGYSSIELNELDERLATFELEVDAFTRRLFPGRLPSAPE